MACLAPFINKDEDPIEILKLDELIAEGSFGTVYKATHASTRQVMAVKIIQLEEDETFDDLVIEIEVMSKCHHENVIGYFGSWRKNDELFIGMELCDGGSAADIYQDMNRALDEGEIASVCRESLKGIRYMHSAGFLHRDIKGANILLKQDGSVKLVDFGVSAHLGPGVPHRRTFIGTPYWMAPEVIENKGSPSPYDWKADVWSLGITLIELAQAEPPLSEIHPMKALFQIPYRNPPTLAKPGMWSQAFNDFVAQCLVKNPKQRASVDELLRHEFVTGSGQYGREVLVSLVARYLVVKKELELEEQKEPVEEQNEEEKRAQEMLEKIGQQKKITSNPLPLPPAVSTPMKVAVPSPSLTPVPQAHDGKKASPQPATPPTHSKDAAVAGQTAYGDLPPAIPSRQWPAPVKPGASAVASALKQPTPQTPSPASGSTPVPISAERPTAAAQRNRPKTVHKGTARRTAEINKNINRRLLKQQITEIKELTRQQQKEVDALASRQAEQKARLLKVATDKANADQKKRVKEDDQVVKRLASEREAELRKGKQDIDALGRTQAALTKTWAKEWAMQSKGALKAFEDGVEERERQEKEAARAKEKETKNVVVSKKVKEHMKQQQKAASVQQKEESGMVFHHQQEMEHASEEHDQALRLKDENNAYLMDQLLQRNETEYANLVAQQQRQIELLRNDQAAQTEAQTRLSDLEIENLKQMHALLHSQFERLKALELEQNKRQQVIEYRDFTKELRNTQKKKLDLFLEQQKDELRAKKPSSASNSSGASGNGGPGTSGDAPGLTNSGGDRTKTPSKQEQKKEKDLFMKSIQEEGEKCHQDKKNKMEEEDAYLRSHQEEQLRSLDKSQTEEMRSLREKHAEIMRTMQEEQRTVIEEVEARHCKERLVTMTVHQQEEAKLRSSLQEARRVLRVENQKAEVALELAHHQAELAQLAQHHQALMELVAALHEAQKQAKAKEFKKDTPISVKDSEMQLLTNAHGREVELLRQAHTDAEHRLAESHVQQRTELSKAHQKQQQQDADKDVAANEEAAAACESALQSLAAETQAVLEKHTSVSSGAGIPTYAVLTSVGTAEQTGQAGAATTMTAFAITVPTSTPVPPSSDKSGARRSLTLAPPSSSTSPPATAATTSS